MHRRDFLQGAAVVPLSGALWPFAAAAGPASRVRPGDAAWPSDALWDRLNRAVDGHLFKVRPSLDPCREAPDAQACRAIFKGFKNPYFVGDDPSLTQTTGWIDAWTLQPSAYVLAAQSPAHVATAVNFARDHNVRIAVRGGGHSYLGSSTAPDSLLIWTRALRRLVLHDAFVAEGCGDQGQPAVSVGAGAIWMHTYHAVTTGAGRFVQGGGCGTVGVAGLVLGGGFGTYSKQFGTAAASLLEAEIVTADGAVRIANACRNPDLFWALKGGGGGTFGVVTRLTLRTHAAPNDVGIVALTVQTSSEQAYRNLLRQFLAFYGERLLNRHWGEVVTLRRGNKLEIGMEFQGIDEVQARALWQPFLAWLEAAGGELTLTRAPLIRSISARHRWDPQFLKEIAPEAVLSDDRPGAPADNIFWAANVSEAGHFIHGFESLWLPATLLQPASLERLVDALLAASRRWSVELHFQKGLAGALPEVIAAGRDTATNPAVLDAFALAIIAGEGPPAIPGLVGHEPDLAAARRNAQAIAAATSALRVVVPDAAAYVAESGYFQSNWQRAYWGANYPKLLAVKQQYDPAGLFFTRHGVGSEAWSDDGFTRLAP